MAKRKKDTFSSAEDIRNELNNLYESDSLSNVFATDEVKPIKDLSPDSIEFKKRINDENFNYFVELSEIYAQEMLAAQKFLQVEAEKEAFLEEYFHDLERSKEIFQKLIARETGITQPLQDVQLERLQRAQGRIANGIQLIKEEINFWEKVQEKLDNNIAAFTTEKNHILNQASKILQDYAAGIGSSDVFIRVPIALTLTAEEKEKLGGQTWTGEMKLEGSDYQLIANNFAAKVGRGEVSFLNQNDYIKSEVKSHLLQKMKQASSFLAGEQQANFTERNMDSPQVKQAVHQATDMIAKHFVEQDAKHGSHLKLIAVSLGEVDAKLNSAMAQRAKVMDILAVLKEQNKSLEATNKSLDAARQTKSTTRDLSGDIKNAQTALTRLAERMVLVEKAHAEFGQKDEADETHNMRNKAF